MQSEQQQRIMGYFIEEAKDHLNTIEQGLLNLQSTIEDSDLVHEVFRAAHSVKGGAAMLGLDSIQKTAHRLEDYFKVLKECPVKVDQKLETLFLKVFDMLQELVEQLQGPFGLTEDKALEVMADAESVFADLHSHLTHLVEQVGGTPPSTEEFMIGPEQPATAAPPTIEDSTEDSALKLYFQSDVPAHLRNMLQLLKQSDTAEVRQQLFEICNTLSQAGDAFDLPYAWTELVVYAQRAIANPDNSFRVLAPALIKDFKQAQDLVLAGRAEEIRTSESLRVLQPLTDVTPYEPEVEMAPDYFSDKLTDSLDDSVSDGDMAELGILDQPDNDLFSTDPFAMVQPSTGDSSDDFDQMFKGLDIEATGTAKAPSESLRNGAEVGAAELNSLADLFENEAPELGMDWQEEVITHTSDLLGDGLELEASSDFSDLLFDENVAAAPPSHNDDDISALLNIVEEESRESEVRSPQNEAELEDFFATDSGASDTLDFDSEFNLEDPSTPSLDPDAASDHEHDLDNLGAFFNGMGDEELLAAAATDQDAADLAADFDLDFDQVFGESTEAESSESLDDLDEAIAQMDPDANTFEDSLTPDSSEDVPDLALSDDFSADLWDDRSKSADGSIAEETTVIQNQQEELGFSLEEELDFSLEEELEDLNPERSDMDQEFDFDLVAEIAGTDSGTGSGDLSDGLTLDQDLGFNLEAELNAIASEESDSAQDLDFSLDDELAAIDFGEVESPQDSDGGLEDELGFLELSESASLEPSLDVAAPLDDASFDSDANLESQTDHTDIDLDFLTVSDIPEESGISDDLNWDDTLESEGTEANLSDLLLNELEEGTEHPAASFDELEELANLSDDVPDDLEIRADASDEDEFALFAEPDSATALETDDFFFNNDEVLSGDQDSSEMMEGLSEGFLDELSEELSEELSAVLTSDLNDSGALPSEDFLNLNLAEASDGSGESSAGDLDDLLGFEADAESSIESLHESQENLEAIAHPHDTTLFDASLADDAFMSLEDAFSEAAQEEQPDLFDDSNAEATTNPFALLENEEELDFESEQLMSDSFMDSMAADIDSDEPASLSELDALLSLESDQPDAVAMDEDAPFSLPHESVSEYEGEVGEEFDTGFGDLDALLNDEAPVSPEMTTPVFEGEVGISETDTLTDEFDDLEVLLGTTSGFGPEPIAVEEPVAATAEDDDFADLERLLEDADQNLGGSPTAKTVLGPSQSSARRMAARRTGALSDQTMRVSVKNLDNLNNLVGELVVNRNSLEQSQERLRQFLDNLLYQVQQLSDVGQRMRDLYERSLLESSLLSSRRPHHSIGPALGASPSDVANHATGASFDALEMDRFTGFHTLSQEMIELIVRVREAASDIDFVVDESDQITRMFRQVTTQLQEGLTRSRMVPFAQAATRLPRAVRDISIKCGKQAEMIIEGKDTLIDKMILEQLYDPMTHLVNNAITHGIETPDERLAGGKPPTGKITIRVFHQGNQTIISVTDDGAGIDPENVKRKAVQRGLISQAEANMMTRLDIYDLLFHHGFSTRDKADDFAGRGVGMDVVRTSLNEIRGVVNIDSTVGQGTTFTIRLPLTLSISKALLCVSNRARIAFPMDGVEDMLDVPRDRIQNDDQGRPCILWRDIVLPFRPLADLLKYNRMMGRGSVYGGNQEEDIISVVVLRSAGNYLALQVDQVLGEQEIVIKQLEAPIPKPAGIAGATVLGDGRIMPIADVLELIDLSMGRIRREAGSSLWEQEAARMATVEARDSKSEPTVLIVDDSITVRELLSMTFNKVGYRVEQARDGQEAWEKLKSGLPCDLVFCDIEMPRMDGLELLSRLQRDPSLKDLPIAMLTSRGADRHRQMAVQLGAKGYFTKPYLEEALLDAAQRMLNGEVMVGSMG